MKTAVRILMIFAIFSFAYADGRQSVLSALSPFAEIEQSKILGGEDVGQTAADYFKYLFCEEAVLGES